MVRSITSSLKQFQRVVLDHDSAFEWAAMQTLDHDWAHDSLREFSGILEGQPGFPCNFARAAFRKKQLYYMFCGTRADPLELARMRAGLLQYLDDISGLTGIEESMHALIILMKPQDKSTSVVEDHRTAWHIMQDWVDHDPAEWPADIPTDPNQPYWSLCFNGVPLFVNVSSPAHVRRRSRNLGRSLVLVTQPRAGFDLVAGPTPEGNGVRERIRAAMERYDGMPAPDVLGHYHLGDLEWNQYALTETNEEKLTGCPLKTAHRARQPNETDTDILSCLS
jgi:FPC/CPF motif-containing protein YcgG